MAKKIGRPKIPKKERKAVFLNLRMSPAEREEIEAASQKIGSPVTRYTRDFIFNPTQYMKTVTLNEQEKQILYRQDPAEGSSGGWQSLLVMLQKMLEERTGRISIPLHILERIGRYAFKYGNGGWEGRLLSIFSRTLGPRLDGNL